MSNHCYSLFDAKQKELLTLMEDYKDMEADIRCNTEQMSIVILIPTAWKTVSETDALTVQEKIKEWSEQYPEIVCYCFDSFSTLLYVLK